MDQADLLKFSLSDLNRRSGELTDKALKAPVLLTKHGRPQLVLMSADHYEMLSGQKLSPAAPPSQAFGKMRLSGLRTQVSDDSEYPEDY